MKVKSEREVAQSCPTLSDPMDYSLPGSSIHGIFQARVLEWGAIAFSASTCNSPGWCESAEKSHQAEHAPSSHLAFITSAQPSTLTALQPRQTLGPLYHEHQQFSAVLSLSRVRFFATPWTAARQASLSITISRSLLKLMSFESVMPPSHLLLCPPLLLLLSIFPSIRVFSNESGLCIRWPPISSTLYLFNHVPRGRTWAMKTTCFPLNFFSSSRTRRTWIFWKDFSCGTETKIIIAFRPPPTSIS